MTSTMPKSERDELRRIVRGDFKALREELEVRRAELLADIEHQVAARYEPYEFALTEASGKIRDLLVETNRGLAAIATELQEHCGGYKVSIPEVWASINLTREERNELRRAAIADLDSRVAHAKARTNRQEIDLLKKLSLGALASEEARSFLREIPTVGELVPASRLKELEAAFGDDGTATP